MTIRATDSRTVFDQVAGNGMAERWRHRLRREQRRLDAKFHAGSPIREVLRGQASLAERLLLAVWRMFPMLHENSALFACGGFGRGELHPYSDVDLLIVRAAGARNLSAIGQFVSTVWATGLRVSHSVRTVDQCCRQAVSDLTLYTAVLESRPLCGSASLIAGTLSAVRNPALWPVPHFYQARLREQEDRRGRFARLVQNLEPHIKQGRGGLRDLHMLCWVALRLTGDGSLRGLYACGALAPGEMRELRDARNLLWRVRYALHFLANRAEDRLSFELQRPLAKWFGYRVNGADTSGVESFMKHYYRVTNTLDLLNEIVLCHFGEIIRPARGRSVALNIRFHLCDRRLRPVSGSLFRRQPHTMLEVFLLWQRGGVDGLTAGARRQLRTAARKAGDAFRADARTRGLFLEIVRHDRRVGRTIRHMHRYGVLDAFLPAFARIRGHMQFDLFHSRSVDEHILAVLEQVDRFVEREDPDRPNCRSVLWELPKRELLYLAALFHDIAKGRGGDHSRLGAHDAIDFCRYLGLGEYDAQQVGWLVENHLLMSHTAQRRDTDDPAVCEKFAAQVGDVDNLNYLYLLTVADISGTNPALWNGWKDNLISALYRRAARILRSDLQSRPGRAERVREKKEQALAFLPARPVLRARAKALWREWGEDYFMSCLPDEIAWHARGIIRHRGDGPLVMLNPCTSRHCTEVFVFMPPRDDHFVLITRVLDQKNLSVVSARVIPTLTGARVLESYSVFEEGGRYVRGRQRTREIITALTGALSSTAAGPYTPVRRFQPSRFRCFRVPTHVRFSDDAANARTIMEVTAADGPGLLCRIARVLRDRDVHLLGARVATYGERAEDVFYLRTIAGRPLTDPGLRTALRKGIIARLEPKAPEDVKAHAGGSLTA